VCNYTSFLHKPPHLLLYPIKHTLHTTTQYNKVINISIRRGPAGLGLELSPSGLGLLLLNVSRPYKDANYPHPADVAEPPLLDGV
jgi:hypothetical protein